jgi:hypothetical protein
LQNNFSLRNAAISGENCARRPKLYTEYKARESKQFADEIASCSRKGYFARGLKKSRGKEEPVRVITTIVKKYRCSVCKTDYDEACDARECEKRGAEKKIFRVGDKVRNRLERVCSRASRPYTFRGMIVKVSGPVAMDTDEAARRGVVNDVHLYEYEVKFNCPHYELQQRAIYYAYELRPR